MNVHLYWDEFEYACNDMKFFILLEIYSDLSLILSSEFEDDPDLYVLKPIKYVGIEVWQVRLVVWTSIMLSSTLYKVRMGDFSGGLEQTQQVHGNQ